MKRLPIYAILLSLVFISLSSCQRRFANTNYQGERINNKTLAVLPYEVITTGRIPREVSEEMLMEIEEAESVAFQASLYHQVLHQLGSRAYRHLDIRIQAYNETNRKLEEAGYTLRETWDIPANELAQLLGVDAVVRSNVHKNKYLTDLESYGIFIAQRVIQAFSRSNFWLYADNRTSDVRISTTIIDAQDGTALWSASRLCPTNWNLNTYDAIERINFSISKRLPR